MTQQSFAARVLLTAFLSVMLVLSACDRKPGANSGGSRAPDQEVTVYVSTDRVFSEPILKAFEEKTGIRVSAVYDTEETKSTGLANRLLAEKTTRRLMSSGRTSRCELLCLIIEVCLLLTNPRALTASPIAGPRRILDRFQHAFA
jgi:hypothetical protein